MSVRNFWIDAYVDGRTASLSGGPRAEDGGMSATIYVRHRGGIVAALDLTGIARQDGTLLLIVELRERDLTNRGAVVRGSRIKIETER